MRKIQAYRIPATTIIIKGGTGKDRDTPRKGFFKNLK
jgi:hypothetical protein